MGVIILMEFFGIIDLFLFIILLIKDINSFLKFFLINVIKYKVIILYVFYYLFKI